MKEREEKREKEKVRKVKIYFKDGAHHYDLRGRHQLDTKWVKEARKLEKLYIKHWLKQSELEY